MKKKILLSLLFLVTFLSCNIFCYKVLARDEKQILPDGIYEIETGVDANKVIEVIDATKISGGNVQIFTRNTEADCQKIKLKYLGNGYYTLTFVHSNMLLDVTNGGTIDHTNVWQCRENGEDAQEWIIQDAGNGYYHILSKSANKYLTVANGGTTNCTNIEIDSKREGDSQKFKFNKIAEQPEEKPIVGTKTIEDGVYQIETGVDTNKVIEVRDATKISGGNVQIFAKNEKADCQKVKVKYLGNGYYTLTFVHSNMLLDVANGGKNDHTNVWQCRENGEDAQKWIIQDAGNGYYHILSKSANKYLTVANGGTTNCTNIEIDSKREGDSQKFKFNKLENQPIVGTKTIEDGTYRIETAVVENKVLEVRDATKISGGNVQIFTKNEKADCQKVKVKYLGDGYYTLTFVHSGMLLDVANGGKNDHTNVWQCRENGEDAQKWIIQDAGNGYYHIISKSANKYLNVANEGTTNCTNIEINSENNLASQKFKFNKIEKSKEIVEGLYQIETGVDENKVLEVRDASKISGGNVQIFAKNAKANCQKVIVKREQDGLYTLTFLHSEMLLDVANGGTNDHTNVWQCTKNGADAQKWILQDAGDGYYNIISESAKKYLTVANGGNANCTNIEICSANGEASQKFRFNELDEMYGVRTIEDGLYEIETGVDATKAIEVRDALKISGGNVQIFRKNNANCQKVFVTYLGEGYYTIRFLHSKMLLDVANGGTNDHTNVWQCRENGEDAQQWIIKDLGNGYYNIISKSAQKYLTVAGGKPDICTNIEINSETKDNSQKFRFNKTEPNFTIDIDTNKYPGYKEALEKVIKDHPTWNVEFLYTGLTFDEVVKAQYSVHNKNLVPSNYSGEWVCSICGTKLYDSGWYGASEKAIAYHMDPRNYLNETHIFQFLELNEYAKDSVSLNGIQSKVNGTFLANYAQAVNNACINTNVNPYYIIARVLQEQGTKGTTIGTGMDGGDGRTYYNPFNIGASGDGYDVIYAGALATAKANGWDTMQKGIEGGITFCKRYYLENYQNTLYLNKFNVDPRNSYGLYTHQYMQNLMAAYSEGITLKNMYANTNTMDSYLTFIIPVYEQMSQTISPKPENNRETTTMNVKVVANGGLNLREEANDNSRIIKRVPNGEVILSVQRAINSDWQKVILTDGTIGYMSGKYLQQVNDVVNCNYSAHVKTADGSGCKIRVGPSTRLELITALPDYTNVTVINEGMYNNIDGFDWVRIILADGRHAFMPSRYLAKN